MAVESDLIAGTITLTNGEDVFTGTGTSWLLSGGRAGDMIIDLPGTPYQGVVKEITSDTSGVLTKPWDGPTQTSSYRLRPQPDGSRVPAEARNLIEVLGNGNLQAAAGLTGSANQVIMFTGPGAMTTISKAELTSGANYDVQVDALADRDAYDGQAEGFSVLISDMGDGRSAITSRVTATTGVWSDPAYVTGPIGETPDVTIGTVTTGDPGTDAEVTANPVAGGVELEFTIPAGEGFVFEGAYDSGTAYAVGDVVRDAGSSWIALQATTGNAPPTLPTTSNAYWELLAQKGNDGAGTGDVVGPASSVDSRMAEFSGTTGKLLKDSGVAVSTFAKSLLDDTSAAASRTTLAAFGVVRRQVFTSSGTYMPHANMFYCEIECIGGGGGSGGLVGNASGHLVSGAGGSGSVSKKIATAADIGVSKAVTVGAGGAAGAAGNNNGGAGGDSSVGTLCVGKGGSFGTGAQSAVSSGIGGAGGAAGTGDIAIPGQSGADGVAGTAVNLSPLQSIGGSTIYGWAAGAKSYSSVGTSGTGYGSGANGAVQTASGSNLAGAAGRPGIVVITEFCSQ